MVEMDEYDMAEYLCDVKARRSFVEAMYEEAHKGEEHPMPMPCWDDEQRIKEIHRLLHIPERPKEWPWIVGGTICGLIIGLLVLVCFVLYYGGAV